MRGFLGLTVVGRFEFFLLAVLGGWVGHGLPSFLLFLISKEAGNHSVEGGLLCI